MPALADTEVAIVGLGLMGGSLALALRPHVPTLLGVDLDPAVRAAAVAKGIVDRADDRLPEPGARPRLTVLATPVRTIVALVEQLGEAAPAGGLLLDLGSTKAEVCRAMGRLSADWAAIGGHPLCGREDAGLDAAAADLFQGRAIVLCRTARTTPELERLALALVEAVGARPMLLDPDAHDRLVALTSHLPYFLAATLVRAAALSDDERLPQLAAAGFHDTSRLAGSDPQMMLDILLTNRAAVAAGLSAAAGELAELLARLDAGDEAWLHDWLAGAQAEHRRIRAAAARPHDGGR